jgi:hypothetical protein
MMRLTAWVTAFTALLLFWHECGEDVPVFCYRIGSGLFTTVRSRALVPVAVSQAHARTNGACSNSSLISSTSSMMSKD